MCLLRRVSGLGLRFGLALWVVTGTARAHLDDGEALSAKGLTPARGATGVCTDTPLSITFSRVPQLGGGDIIVHRADGSAAVTIHVTPDTQATSQGHLIAGSKLVPVIGVTPTIGGTPIVYYQAFIHTDTATATIDLHQALDYGQTYYVTMGPDVFHDAAGHTFPGISDPDTWRFSTKASAPPAETPRLTVAADGTGDFSTVQGAIDFVPSNNTRRVFILVRKGTYTEINNVPADKRYITLYGEDRNQTIIQYPNNTKLQLANPNGAHTYNRYMFNVEAPDFTLANVTLHNITSPVGFSQAEAFRSNNERIVLDRVNLESLQDTLLANRGTAYIANSFLSGNVDYMWGSAAVFFNNCELQMVSSKGYYTQVRNPEGSSGFIYANCSFTRADDTVVDSYLSRIDPKVYPSSQVVLLHCVMGPHIRPEGWLLNNATEAPHVRFWEYRSTDPSGTPVDVSHRAPFSRQLTAAEARSWSEPAFVLRGWVPDLKSLLPPGQ